MRREGLAVLVLVLCLAGAPASAAGWQMPSPSRFLTALSDDQLAGARVVTGFTGHHPPRGLRRMIEEGRVSGVILFDGNAGSRRSVSRLTLELQTIPRPAGADQPLLVTVDQEGGLVRRLPGPPTRSAEQIGAKGAGFAERVGTATGKSLHSMGVNVDLAPVLDLGRPGRAIADEHRAFARTPAAVSERGVSFARGLASGGVAGTAKHFPGLGAARINTDNAIQRIRLPAAKLRSADELPYSSFVAAGGAMVMLSTAIYPALSARPAAFSREIATGELRERLGFQGVSITDALGTVSARTVGGPGRAAVTAAAAGSDLVLFTDLGDASRAQRALSAALTDARLDRAEFQSSVDRVLALRGRFAP